MENELQKDIAKAIDRIVKKHKVSYGHVIAEIFILLRLMLTETSEETKD